MSKFSPKGKVKIVKGSILNPEYAGLRLILNFVNLNGKPEGTIFKLFNKKWTKVSEETKGWYASRINFKLGAINTIAVQSDTWIVNCLCQNEKNEVQESAIEKSLKEVLKIAKDEKASLHVSNLLLTSYPKLQETLEARFVEEGINVSYYEEPVT